MASQDTTPAERLGAPVPARSSRRPRNGPVAGAGRRARLLLCRGTSDFWQGLAHRARRVGRLVVGRAPLGMGPPCHGRGRCRDLARHRPTARRVVERVDANRRSDRLGLDDVRGRRRAHRCDAAVPPLAPPLHVPGGGRRPPVRRGLRCCDAVLAPAAVRRHDHRGRGRATRCRRRPSPSSGSRSSGTSTPSSCPAAHARSPSPWGWS